MKAKAYHIGYVMKNEMSSCMCCRLVSRENVMFEYIAIVYEDGTEKFYYEDEEEFAHFERNFHSNRFTSYHEFFTTKELAIESRGALKLRYYVRKPQDVYEKVNLTEKRNELEKLESENQIVREEDKITRYGQYDTCVNE